MNAAPLGLRCAPWARAVGVDPIGTAGCYAGFCLVEWPLPWPRDLGAVPELAALAAATSARRFRLQGLVPPAGATRFRVAVYHPGRPGGGSGFDRFVRAEATCPAGEVAGTALWLLDSPPPSGPVSAGGSDVLVCTHGRRDACCGSLGTALAAELEGAGGLPAGARLWRTSHTGGHRFAPTAIVLPEGTAWAFLDAATLRRIVGRTGALGPLVTHYRGCAGLGSPAVQVLERAVLAEIGWGLFDCVRIGTDLGGGGTRLETVARDGASSTWEGLVGAGRLLPVPHCGQPITGTEKQEAELTLSGLRRVR